MNNSVVISAALTVIALVLAIFGASWLNQRALSLHQQATRDLLLQMEKRFDARFNSIEQRLDKIKRQLEAIFKPILPPR